MAEQNDRLVRCACEGNVGEVMDALKRDPTLINAVMDWHQDRLLALACWNGHDELAHKLLEHNPKPDINAANDSDSTALHRAAYKNNLAMVNRLIEAGADYHAKDRMGRTPANLGNEEIKASIQVRLDAEIAAWEEREAVLRAEREAQRQLEENQRLELVRSRFSKAVNVVVTGSVSPKVNGVYVPKGEEHESGDWPVYEKQYDPEMNLLYVESEWLIQTTGDRSVDEQSRLDMKKFDDAGAANTKGKRPARICRAFLKFPLAPADAPEKCGDGQGEPTEFKKWMGAFFTSKPCNVRIRTEKEMEGSEELELLRKSAMADPVKRGSIQMPTTTPPDLTND